MRFYLQKKWSATSTVYSRLPIKKAIPAKEYKRKFDSLVARTREFSLKHKLNIYKKAKLLNTIKWEMKDAGHEEVVINEFISFITPLL